MSTSSAASAEHAESAGAAELAVEVVGLSHAYGARPALRDVTLGVRRGEAFALLGPNGGGKTTLFRLLCTLLPVQAGAARVLGFDLTRAAAAIRARVGVVFQSPSLDRQLSISENIAQQGALYGLAGRALRVKRDELLAAFGLADRARERVATLSGGLRRRVELAKSLLHDPELLLLDEPGTGLDPAARAELWSLLPRLRDERGVTLAFTTHLLDEADKADRVAILHQGRLVAFDTPNRLKASVGGDTLAIETADPAGLAADIHSRFGLPTRVVDDQVRLELPEGHAWIARLVEAFPGRARAIRLGKPTLEDVFIARVGARFGRAADAAGDAD